MKFFIKYVAFDFGILGVLNYVYFAKDIVSTVVLLSLSVKVSSS